MSYLAKQKLFYYKRYKLDIWGLFRNTLQTIHDKTVYRLPNCLFTLKIEKKMKIERDKELVDLNKRYKKAYDLYKSNIKK